MQIIQDKALVVNTRNPERITNVINKSANLGEIENGLFQVLVKWTLGAAQKLRTLRIKGVPSPIQREYSYPGAYKPFLHQRTTAEFLTLHKKSFCFSEAGVGKTGSAIWAADYLIQKKIIRRVLVICPLSIMQSAWQSELFKLVPGRSVGIAQGKADQRKKIVRGDYEFIIVNYDGVEIIADEILRDGTFDLIIIDEANALKTTTTKRWKTTNKLVGFNTWVWMMTGTPAAQSPADAYGLAKIVCPDRVPKFFGTFRDMVMRKEGPFRWIPRTGAEDTVFSVLQPAVRFTKEQCLDLPDMLYQTREVSMTLQQEKYYANLKTQMTMLAAGEDITAVNAAVLMNKLLQISAGSVYADGGATVEFDASNRLNVVREIIDESSHKVLIFAQFTHSIDQIETYLKKHGYTVEVIDGRKSGKARHELIGRFQKNKTPQVLVIQPQAAAHGITLTAANTVIWFSPTTSLENYIQANARVHRQGQKNSCLVVHIQGSPVEKKIYTMLQARQDVHLRIVDLYKDI